MPLQKTLLPRLAAACLLAAGLGACDHLTDPAGPNLIDRFGPFALVEPVAASTAAVDFPAGETVTFSAEFNKQVNWVLEITGRESGAVKRIEGFSRVLDNQNTRWDGGTTELPLFKDELVDVVLTVPDEAAEPTATTVEVLAPRAYPGEVAADFEGGDEIAVLNPEFEFEEVGISDEIPPAQGDGFFLLRGTDDVVANNFFIGLATITPPGGGTFAVPTTIASDLYFNAFLYGYGTDHTIAVVEVVIDNNGTGTYEAGQDRIVPLGGDVEFPNVGVVDFEGWRLYSEPADSFGQFGAGISDADTDRIVAIRIVLISDANAQPRPPEQVEFGIDYLTFTAGGPLPL